MRVIGIDLAGPANHQDTVMTIFRESEEGLYFEQQWKKVSDDQIIRIITELSAEQTLYIGLDAPLSYQDGGGLRAQDRELQIAIGDVGMRKSSIMPPTFTKMVYLTLRGVTLTRTLLSLPTRNRIRIAEVHPGAVFGMRMTDKIDVVLNYKTDFEDRSSILTHFPIWKVYDVPQEVALESHTLDSCGAALGVWNWSRGEAKWEYQACPPYHPFPVVC
ncbi:DUF429 domain-containing protein [Ammoniphilus sp. CFH 90114]|uniref:DUF429 domain-containing protein n=1 Tax=Ammoniphilus sp. CFH 90114 TaxID=2493665 RepID=UPI00100F0AB3|nr:DUF429 domain-containing protein [Ammoniphilus sp. CFH 90114]RXT06556.1 DUF429 domain-containing protein [Ammoniphilus sp. CFH 90114]